MKHPKWRVSAIDIVADLAPEVLGELQEGCEKAVLLLPDPSLIVDFEITGSYARRAAQLHSDLDMNIATGSEGSAIENAKLLHANIEQFRAWHRAMREIGSTMGIRFEFAFEHFSVKSLGFKQVYSLRERKYYGDKRKKHNTFWKLYQDGWKPKQKGQGTEYRKPQDGDEYFDPWADEVERWAERYGKHYQRMGETPDTVWAKGLNL